MSAPDPSPPESPRGPPSGSIPPTPVPRQSIFIRDDEAPLRPQSIFITDERPAPAATPARDPLGSPSAFASPATAVGPPPRLGPGPRRSVFKWPLLGVFIRIFRLSVKLLPFGMALAGGVYSYTYFFGSIPLLDAIKAQLGFEVPEQVAQPSRVEQALQQTRNVVAASDSRIQLANAIAAEDFETADALESAPTGGNPNARRTSPLDEGDDDYLVAGAPMPTASGRPASEPRTYALSQLTSQVLTLDDTGRQRMTVVHDASDLGRFGYHNIDYRTGPPASAEFRRWLQTIKIGQVELGIRPRVELYDEFFSAGAQIDWAIGITFAGLADNDTVLVFRERSGAYLPVKF